MNGSNKKNKFQINEIIDIDDNPFDRQERIAWWDQKKLKNAKVMVVGAGAIGNETLKNLALLGIGNIFIVDFDTVSTSNLSRTVLFRQADKGKKKAEIAASRTKELSLLEEIKIGWFHGDAVWELGTGVFRSMDIVLGCLDNVETRFAINRQCWLANTPWIDSGIYELGGHVSVFVPPEPPCYQCGATNEQLIAARKRYSCDDFKRAVLDEGKMPTVQITSSIISAIQVQEAIKFLCGQPVSHGKKIYFQGKINDFDVLGLPVKNDCMGHVTYPDIIPLPLTHSVTLKDFLKYVTQDQYSGTDATLDFRSDRTFVVSVSCKNCGVNIEMYKPAFRIFDTETVCHNCKSKGVQGVQDKEQTTTKQIEVDFSLFTTSSKMLEMSLAELGIPNHHVVAVFDKHNNYKYYELSEDQPIFQTC
jgi:adenylyltransferase/sulfurtransferase